MNEALKELLPAGVTVEDIFTLMAALAAMLVVLAVWFGLLVPQVSTRRVKELAARRNTLRSGLLATRRRVDRTRSVSFMRRVVQKLNLERSNRTEAMMLKLAQAGWRSREALVRYLFFRFATPIALGVVAVVLLQVMNIYNMSVMMRLAACVGAVILGWMAPDIIIKNAIQKRAHKMRRGLPDAIDLMVICSEAGLSLDAMLKRVSEEFHKSCPTLADELALASLELGFLTDRRQALINLANRTGLPGIRALVNSLNQADKFGTPLSQSLRVLAAEFREDRMLKAEEKGARLPAMLTVPMIVFILPPLFIVLIGPAILRTIDALSNM